MHDSLGSSDKLSVFQDKSIKAGVTSHSVYHWEKLSAVRQQISHEYFTELLNVSE